MKKKEVIKILEDNEITNVTKPKPKIIYTKTFSCANDHPIVYYVVDEDNEGICEYCYTKFIYKEKTYSEKMQDELETIKTYEG